LAYSVVILQFAIGIDTIVPIMRAGAYVPVLIRQVMEVVMG
jgi:hypothetical protein